MAESMIGSKALEINLANYHVDVEIDPKYSVLQEVMSNYFGLMEGLNNFLRELSHPYKNWEFIVQEARGYSLDYFHLLVKHPKGSEAADIFIQIFFSAVESENQEDTRVDAVDNLILYLLKIIKDSDSHIEKFMPVIDKALRHIQGYPDADFFLFLKSFYPVEMLAETLLNRTSGADFGFEALNQLLFKSFHHIYSYWLAQEDPWAWFEKKAGQIHDRDKVAGIFRAVSHEQLKKWDRHLAGIQKQDRTDAGEITRKLVELPGYKDLVETYRQIPQKIYTAGRKSNTGNQWKTLFLLHIMNTSGLAVIHEESLREINRTVSWLISHVHYREVQNLIETTFSVLSLQAAKFPATALTSILNMGKGVYKTEDVDLINFFIDSVIRIGFQTPMIGGVGNDWQVKVNSAHVQNIRTWLELIEINPKRSTRLISGLIIHLSLCGIFIKDTDLFPREITRLLNSAIEPAYNLIKQLARLFPVYFNDIGAEGQLRDISTRLDEMSHRRDVLVHFLRKQTHVESSNRIIGFMEAIFKFWQTKQKKHVQAFVPPTIYDQIETDGPFVEDMHHTISRLSRMGVSVPEALIDLESEKLRKLFKKIKDIPGEGLERFGHAVKLYQLLHQKYTLGFTEMENLLGQLKPEAFPDLENLKKAISEPMLRKKLFGLLAYLEELKKLILSSRTFEIREDIYKKRHFAVDIPSMYGCYHEMKFDVLGLTLRLESLVNVLFEDLIAKIDLNLITKATFFQIYSWLVLFESALSLDGISSVEFKRQMDLLSHSLEVKGFSLTQYLDIFKGFVNAVKNINNDYFVNIHEENLSKILSRLPVEQILSKFLPQKDMQDPVKLNHMVSEVFIRDRITISLGLQQLDRFLGKILSTLFRQSEKLPKDKLSQLLNYDPKRAIVSLDEGNENVRGIIYLGNKGLNLVRLKNLGLPVPPGFIVTTEVFRCREIIEDYPPAEQNLKEQVARHIGTLERDTGKTFGNPKNPLLFSVRSGSSISQPGMLDTFLDVGINEQIAAGMAHQTKNPWFAWDNYRRFLQCYGMSLNLARDEFDAVINDFKLRSGIPFKSGFSGEQMRKVALSYRQLILDSGIQIIEDPFTQLYMTVKNVFSSWWSEKARTYRQIMGISDDWGTAVTVQSMVYGNISQHSGSGVIFTHNPRWSEDTLRLWGDFTLGNQGEDVVSGLVTTMPISQIQQETEKRQTETTLETYYPEIYLALKGWANDLIYNRGWSPQEMEFTFEGPSVANLFLLQTRDMAIRERKKFLTFDIQGNEPDRFLAYGIGVSGGAMSGRVVFSLPEIDQWREREPDTDLILVRGDTVPDDIKEIYSADGLLTAKGGVTSHAAVVAHRLGKTCVVGCGNLNVDEKKKICGFKQVILMPGDYISIDGHSGNVYQGLIKTKEA